MPGHSLAKDLWSVRSHRLQTELAMSPLFPSRFEEVLFWVAFILGATGPLIYFARWSRRNAASAKARPGKDLSTLINFALFPAALLAIFLGYARIAAKERIGWSGRRDPRPRVPSTSFACGTWDEEAY